MAESGRGKPPEGEIEDDEHTERTVVGDVLQELNIDGQSARSHKGSAQTTRSTKQIDGSKAEVTGKPPTGRVGGDSKTRQLPKIPGERQADDLCKANEKVKTNQENNGRISETKEGKGRGVGKFILDRRDNFERDEKADSKDASEMKTFADGSESREIQKNPKREGVDTMLAEGSSKKLDEISPVEKPESSRDTSGNMTDKLTESFVIVELHDTDADETSFFESKGKKGSKKNSLDGSLNVKERKPSINTVTKPDASDDKEKGSVDKNKQSTDVDNATSDCQTIDKDKEASDKSKEKEMTIIIKTLTGEMITIRVQHNERVESVKSKIDEQLKIAPERQRLIHAGKQFEDGRTLAMYDITDQSTLHLVVKKGSEEMEDNNNDETPRETISVSKKEKKEDETVVEIVDEKQDGIKDRNDLNAVEKAQATRVQIDSDKNQKDDTDDDNSEHYENMLDTEKESEANGEGASEDAGSCSSGSENRSNRNVLVYDKVARNDCNTAGSQDSNDDPCVGKKTHNMEKKHGLHSAYLKDSMTKKEGSETKKEDSETMKEDFKTEKEDSETKKEDLEMRKKDSETKKVDSETEKEDSETKKEDAETKKEASETERLAAQSTESNPDIKKDVNQDKGVVNTDAKKPIPTPRRFKNVKGTTSSKQRVQGFHSGEDDQISLPQELPARGTNSHLEKDDEIPRKVRSTSLPGKKEILAPQTECQTFQPTGASKKKTHHRKQNVVCRDGSSSGLSSDDDCASYDIPHSPSEDIVMAQLEEGIRNLDIKRSAGISSEGTLAVNIKVLYKGKWEDHRKVSNIGENMKFHFALNNDGYLAKANSLKKKQQLKMSCDHGILHVDPGEIRHNDFRDYAKSAWNSIKDCTADVEVNSWPVAGTDMTKVINSIHQSELGKVHELFIKHYGDELYVAYNAVKSSMVANVVSEALKMFSFARETKTKKCMPYIFCKILGHSEWKDRLHNVYSDIVVTWETNHDNDVVEIMFKGYEEEVKEAIEWFDKEVSQEYGTCSTNLSSIPELECFPQPEHFLLQYLKLKYGVQGEIQYAVNEYAGKIWLSSSSKKAQAEVTEAMNSLQKKGGIVKTVTISVEGKLTEEEVKDFVADNTCEYIRLNFTEGKIMVKGLEKLVNETKKKVKEVLNTKLETKTKCTYKKTFFELKDNSMFDYFQNNNVLKEIAEKCHVRYDISSNSEAKGIYFEGEEKNCLEFLTELKQLAQRVTTKYIKIKLDKTFCRQSTALEELVHKIEIEQDVRVQISKNVDRIADSTVKGSTMKEDLQDYLHVKWKHHDTCAVTCIETSSEFLWQDVVFVPVHEGHDSAGGMENTGTAEKILVPIPSRDVNKAKHKVESTVDKALEKVKTQGCFCISVQVKPIDTWAKYDYVKGIFPALLKWQEKQEKSRIDIILCCEKSDAYVCSLDICKGALPKGTEYEEVKPINKGHYDFEVRVEKAEISKVSADVIVNSTSPKLNFSQGSVSVMLLKSAGPELQEEVYKKRPSGIKFGEIVETSAYRLKDCKYVFHGALDDYKGEADLQKLEDFVYKCFEEANMKRCESIALPAIGTGNLDFPKPGVARAMFGAAKKYYRDHHPSSLRCVKFVVYHKDTCCLKEFQEQKKHWDYFLRCQTFSIVYGGVRLQLDHGCFAQPGTDAIIYLWDNSKIHGTIRDNSLLLSCGKEVRNKIKTHMRGNSAEPLITRQGYVKAEIFWMPCKNAMDNIYQAVIQCFLTADEKNTVRSVSIAFDKTHSFLLHDELVHTLCKVVKDVSQEIKNIDQVFILVESRTDLDRLLKHFSEIEKDSFTEDKQITIEVYGFEKEVETAISKLTENFQLVQQDEAGNDAKLLAKKDSEGTKTSKEQDGSDDKKQSEAAGENRYIEYCETFAKYVEVKKIPKHHDKDSLRPELFKEGVFPVSLPVLIYCKGSENALLLCQKKEDAVELSGFTNLEPFDFSLVKGKAVSFLSSRISETLIQKIQEEKKYEQFKKEIKDAGIQIKVENPFQIVAPTSYQYRYAKMKVEEFNHVDIGGDEGANAMEACSMTPPKANDFQNVETLQEVDENVWEVLRFSDEYRQLKEKCKDISYIKGSIIIELSGRELSQEVSQMKDFVASLKEQEIEEIKIQETNSENVNKWCNEIKDVLGYGCCVYINEKNKVLAHCKTYEDLRMVNHMFKAKSGQIKLTGKGRRHGKKADSEKEPASLDFTDENETMSNDRNQFCSTFNWEANTNHVERYNTAENIKVFAYEANILELPVDCIVNAANDRLNHGGGVAAVIENAAGSSLTREGDRYIRQHGPLPVGSVMTTTAGRLKYVCVIHAVGPRWSDYYPHSLKDVQECETHLYQAVHTSLLEAEKRSLKSIALPAISSAIFGVPEEMCVYQYAKATADYSKKTPNQPNALKEVHFIDKNYRIVQKIQAMFTKVFRERQMPPYDSESFVETKSRHRNSSVKYQSSKESHTSYPRHGYDQAGQETSSDEPNAVSFVPISYLDVESGAHVYHLCSNSGHGLFLSKGDLFKARADTIVISVDENGRRGMIARALAVKIPKYKDNDYTRSVSNGSKDKKLSDVFLTDGFNCGYQYILHAVYQASLNQKSIQDRKPCVQKLYDSIFSTSAKHKDISSVATTLLGTDMSSKEDIRMCAEIFLKSYLQNCLKLQVKGRLQVHLVCREDIVFKTVKDTFDNYVKERSAIPETKVETHKGNTHTDEAAAAKQPPEIIQGLDSCVICMDTVTNPMTLECGHTFCTECIEQQFTFKEACPTCGKVCGTITGDQPDNGTMRYAFSKASYCAGYEHCGQIIITYNFPSGRQGPNHPNPGQWYKGITRVAYLPNNEEGRNILAMLKIAFYRKLVFTIGSSRTTGEEGVITWNDIHHKTDFRSNRQFGYPDPGYLERVKDELAAKGITEKDISEGNSLRFF